MLISFTSQFWQLSQIDYICIVINGQTKKITTMKITIQISDMATTIGNMLGFEDVMVMAIMYNPN